MFPELSEPPGCEGADASMSTCENVFKRLFLYSLPEANSIGFRSGILSGQSFRCPIRKFQYVVIFHSLDVIVSIHNVNVASRQRTPEILRISDGRRGFPFAPLCAPRNLKGRPCHSYANLWRNFENSAKFRHGGRTVPFVSPLCPL